MVFVPKNFIVPDIFETDIYAWLVEKACEKGDFALLEKDIKTWVADAWPFKNPHFKSFKS